MDFIDTQAGNIAEQLKAALMAHMPIAYLPTADISIIQSILYSPMAHGAIIPRLYCKGADAATGEPVLACLNHGEFFADNQAPIADNYIFNTAFRVDDLRMPSVIVLQLPDWKSAPASLYEFVRMYCGAKNAKGYVRSDKIDIVRRSLCIVTTPGSMPVPPQFSPYVRKIGIPPLSDTEIRDTALKKMPELNAELMSMLVVSLRGFSKSKIESVFDEITATAATDTAVPASLLEAIRTEKKSMMDDSPGLKWETPGAVKAAGLDSITHWIDARKDIFADPRRAAVKNIDIPNGVLISGIPGSGKSLMAKTAASMLSLPLISLDMGALLGGLMGQSEHNMIQALHMAEQMAPCVLWIDEIEKAFSASAQGSSASDGGVGRRMFGKFLTWMQEKTSACFVFATSNDISALPPELFRSERFDRKFFTFMPTADECAIIFSEIIKKENKKYSNHISTLSKAEASQLPGTLFHPAAEKKDFWLEVINTACAPSSSNFELKKPEKDGEPYLWAEKSQPCCKLMTGADIAALIKELKFNLYSLSGSRAAASPSVYNANTIKYSAISIMQSPDFKPYGETNLKDIVECFNRLYINRFVPASGDCILNFANYDEPTHTYRHSEDTPTHKNRYDQALYYVLVGAINHNYSA